MDIAPAGRKGEGYIQNERFVRGKFKNERSVYFLLCER